MSPREYAEAKSKAKAEFVPGEYSDSGDAIDHALSEGFDAGYEYALKKLRQQPAEGKK